MTLPSEILAFKLLRKANFTKEEKMLVLTGMNYENRQTLYEETKQSLKKFKGDRIHEKEKIISLKLAFFAEKEKVLLASGFVRKSTQQSREATSGYKNSNHHNRGSRIQILLDWMDKSLHVDSVDPIDI